MTLIWKASRLSLLVLVLVCASGATGDTSLSNLWSKFQEVRQGTRALHQEFDVTERTHSTYRDGLMHNKVVIDISEGKWREQSVGGSDDLTRIFNGHDIFISEPGGTEYAKEELIDKDNLLQLPYNAKLDWGKAKELERLPCGFSGKDHPCIVIEAPMKPWVVPGVPGEVIRLSDGTSRVMIDTETGIWLKCRINALVEGKTGSSSGGTQLDVTYSAVAMTYGSTADEALFKLPENLHKVDYLTPWDEKRIKKELLGKPVPEMQFADMHGNHFSLADLKGKTVLLDFWTTWCPPCQSDAPVLDKLNQKYGEKNLAIVGISVDEDRDIVEKFLKKHPHGFPIVLSSENLMPRPYQVHVLPTYLIIGPDGTLLSAEEGDKGFGKLRKDLEKAGMQTE